MGTLIDVVGQKFGRLTVVSMAPPSVHKQSNYLCKCECGNEKIINAQRVRNGLAKSCGCLRKEITAERNSQTKRTHGMSKTYEYKIWAGMLVRCSIDHSRNSAHFGRGIKVCERWSKFENFIADMGLRPSKRHSIDRIDNDGDYAPDNCRWAVSKEQCNNTRLNIHITFNGETKTLAQWADATSINYQTLRWRFRQGWNNHDIFRPV